MLTIISPAKSMDFEGKLLTKEFTTPESLSCTQKLAKEIQKLNPSELSLLMDISSELAMLNFERYAYWNANHDLTNSRQAIYAYNGDVYQGLQAKDFSKKDLNFAQQHLLIVSGFYGLLKPLDLIKPYRLEMSIKLGVESENKKNLYEFWSKRMTNTLNHLLEEQKSDLIINLASQEYSKVIDTKALHAKIISPVFKDYKNESYKVVAIYAKKARGSMSSFIIRNQIDDNNVEELKNFKTDGYEYTSSLSNENEWVFTRESNE